MTLVPHSVGLNRPQRPLPPGACDSHMHIFDPRFAPSSQWPRTPPVAPVAAYRQLQARLGTTRTVVVTPSTYGTDNACTLDALDQLGDQARGVAVVGPGVAEAELSRLANELFASLPGGADASAPPASPTSARPWDVLMLRRSPSPVTWMTPCRRWPPCAPSRGCWRRAP